MDSYVELTAGTVYDQSNGDQYKCLGKTESGTLMERVSDGWMLVAHGTRQDEHGLICWNYSTGGHWPDKGARAEKICKHRT